MKLFTIGFTKKTAEAFFTRLQRSGTKRVVDVRLNNVSQLAGFAKRNDLPFFLREICDIDYVHDGRLVLRFQDGSFKDPFIARYVSDGTIKMFAYLVLLYDPRPPPLLAVEKPENQLYLELLDELVEEFRDYARRGGQVFVSTHSPDWF